MRIQEKTKMCKFPLNETVQKTVQISFLKLVQSGCFCLGLKSRIFIFGHEIYRWGDKVVKS